MTRTQQAFLGSAGVLALVLLVGGRIALSGRTEERNDEFLPDMVESVPYDAFAKNPVFPDGKTLREPVPGTVARGARPIRDARALANPFRSTPEVVERGRKVFQSICAACHGPGGRGDGAATKRGVPPPPSLLGERLRALKDGEIFQIVTFGQGNMAPHAALVERDDRWKVVHFLRTLKEGQP